MWNDDRYERMQAGKKIVATEYGVKYPDGTIDWNAPNHSDTDIRTARGREGFKAERSRRLADLHQPDTGVTFVTRTATTRYSEPAPIGD